MYYYNNGFGFPWFMFGWGLICLIIVILIFAFMASRRQHYWHGNYWHWYDHETEEHKEPLDIIKERYAKGEINKEEFERIKKDLQDSH